jgi:hypothetical protein
LVYGSCEAKVETFNILKSDIENLYYSKDKESDFVRSWVDGHFLKRTKEQFDTDLQTILNKFA